MSGKAKKKQDKERNRLARVQKESVTPQQKPARSSDVREGVIVQRGSLHVGPIPAPDTLREYNDVIENGAERIMGSWERQMVHRQRIENRESWSEVLQRFGGLIASTAIILLGLYFGWDLAKAGKDAGAIGSILVAGGGVVGAIFNARKHAGKT